MVKTVVTTLATFIFQQLAIALYPGRRTKTVIKILGNVNAITLTRDKHAKNVNPGTKGHSQAVVAAVMKNMMTTAYAKVNQKTIFTILLLICCVVALLYHK